MKKISLTIPLTVYYLLPLAKLWSKTFEMVYTGLVESPRNQKR